MSPSHARHQIITFAVGGRSAHERMLARIERDPAVKLYQARLRRTGSRRRRISTPTFESRIVVGVSGGGELRGARQRTPYRGVSADDLRAIIDEVGAEVADVASVAVRLERRFHDRARAQRLCDMVLGDARVEANAVIQEIASELLGNYIVSARAHGDPRPMTILLAQLRVRGALDPWDLRVNWLERG